MKLSRVVRIQRDFFLTDRTKNVEYRKSQLKRLKNTIGEHEASIYDALHKDLSKSEYESYLTEVSIVKQEIDFMIKNLDSWAGPVKKKCSISAFPNRNYTVFEPYGVVLVLSPWNYPFHLSLLPVVGALAAGNCVILKASPNSINTANVLRDMINSNFEANYLYMVDDATPHDDILKEKYDYIFFTGSSRVGRIVMRAASEHLTPVSLELGGKSPCIVDKTADLSDAAKKIVWGKCINSGQTCVAPDYILADEEIKDDLVKALWDEIERNHTNCVHEKNYPKIINLHHYMRLCRLIDKESNVIGGERNEKELKIAPTIMPDATFSSEAMKDEIFGPILPVLTYSEIDGALRQLKQRPKPLACYIFTGDNGFAKKICFELSFGGGCVNDCVLHIANHNLPFGGVGNSGMGTYHGEYSFKTFSHEKAVLVNRRIWDISLRFPPFTEKKLNRLRRLFADRKD